MASGTGYDDLRIPWEPSRRDVWAGHVVDAAMLLLSRRTRDVFREGMAAAVIEERTRRAPAPELNPDFFREPVERQAGQEAPEWTI